MDSVRKAFLYLKYGNCDFHLIDWYEFENTRLTIDILVKWALKEYTYFLKDSNAREKMTILEGDNLKRIKWLAKSLRRPPDILVCDFRKLDISVLVECVEQDNTKYRFCDLLEKYNIHSIPYIK
jgi:hypothetical protein